MTYPEDLFWTQHREGKLSTWVTGWNPERSRCGTIIMRIQETDNKRLPFDVYVCGVQVGFKKTLEAAKACAVRQAKLRLEAEENAR